MIRRLAAALAVAGGLVACLPAAAQRRQPPRSPPARRPRPAAYEDRLIDGGALAPELGEEGGAPYNPEGWPRYFRVEGVASYFDQQGLITRENGGRLSARIDTPSYGAISVDATARVAPGSFIATLIQRDFAFDNNWRVNNGLGVVTSLGIDLTRSQYRFYIPTFPTVGGTTEWLHDGDLQLQASVGEPGNYDGFRLTGFQSLGGSLATVGAQWAFAPQWQAGVQFVDARNVQSAYAVERRQRRRSRARRRSRRSRGTTGRRGCRANFLYSDASFGRVGPRANGAVARRRSRCGTATHHYGVFRLEPGLSWGYQPINNDIQGAYYRIAYQSLRWQFDGGIDRVNSVSGRGNEGTFFTITAATSSRRGPASAATRRTSTTTPTRCVARLGLRRPAWSQGVSRLQVSTARNTAPPKAMPNRSSSITRGTCPPGRGCRRRSR